MNRGGGWLRGVALAAVVALLGTLTAAGCTPAEKVGARAVARGVMSSHPFFRAVGLGLDAYTIAQALDGGQKSGGAPGVYGGTRKTRHCDKAALVGFLTDKRYAKQAKAWADVLGIEVADIARTVKKWTPVLLRNDTLVKNHDWDTRKKKRIDFTALLEAGIAVLVDEFGQPVVQCSCGNPLQVYDKDIDDIDLEVDFDKRNKKWKRYEEKKVVQIEKADAAIPRYELVDAKTGDTGLLRPGGSSGGADEVLPVDPALQEGELREVPDLAGLSYAQAEERLAEAGLTITLAPAEGAGEGETGATEESAGSGEASADPSAVPEGYVVTGQDPEPGTELAEGGAVSVTMGPQPDTTEGTVEGTTEGTSEGTAEGTVEGTTEGSASTGTGEGPVAVPALAGMSVAQAEAELAAAGLVVAPTSATGEPPAPDWIVQSQSPEAGAEVPAGSTVTVFVAPPPAP